MEIHDDHAVADQIGHLLTLIRRHQEAAARAKDSMTRDSCNAIAEFYARQALSLGKQASDNRRQDARSKRTRH